MSEEEWANVPGDSARRKADELRAMRAQQSLLARIGLALSGGSAEERAWRKGAKGEQVVGRRLAKLPAPWVVLHDLTIGRQGANLDHLVIGPPGVFAINTKCHTGNVTVYDRAILHNGTNRHYIPKARSERLRVEKALGSARGRAVDVTSVLVFVGGQINLRRRPTDVEIMGSHRVPKWFLKQKDQVLSPAEVLQLAALASQPSTWGRRVKTAAPARINPVDLPTGTAGVSTRAVLPPRPPARDIPALPTTPDVAPDRMGPAQTRGAPVPQASSPSALMVRRWRRFGHDRLYLNDGDGTTLGHLDLKTGDIVVKDPSRTILIRARLERARSNLDSTP